MNEQLQKHIRSIRLNRLWIILLVVIAVGSMLGASWLEEQCYSTWVDLEEGTVSSKIDSITRAIALQPERLEGYYRVLDIYLEDGVLSRTEQTKLKTLLLQYQSKMTNSEDDLAALYRVLAFTHMNAYDATVQQRLKAAYPYFESADLHAHTEDLEQMVVEAYLDIAAYYEEYIWLTGTLRKPTASEVTDMIRHARSLLDSFPESADIDRLAYACILADLLTQHGDVWVEIAGNDTVAEFAAKVENQLSIVPEGPAAQKLWEELSTWKNEIHTWEEVEANGSDPIS